MRPISRARAFSLIEVLVASTILVFAFLPIVSTLTTANRQSQQAGDYGLGITLSSFVAEEVRLANWENPHLQEQYLAGTGAFDMRPVIGGASPFFTAIEDDARPWGRLLTGEDTAIVEGMQPLHGILKDFGTGMEVAVRPLESGGRVMDLGVKTRWIDFQQKEREHGLRVTVGRLATRGTTPDALLDRAIADAAIRESMFPEATGSTLENAVAAEGLDLELVRAIGELALVGRSMGEREPRDQQQIRELGQQMEASGDPLVRAPLARRRAALLERLAGQRLIAMEHGLAKSRLILERLPALTGGTMGNRIRNVIDDMQPLLASQMRFANEVVQVEQAYRELFDAPLGPTLPPRQRLRVGTKLADVHRLRLLTRGPQDLSFLHDFLDFLQEMERGRNQNFVDLARAERARSQTWQDVVQNYQRPASLEAYRDFPAAIFPAFTLMRARALASTGGPGESAPPPPPQPPRDPRDPSDL